MAKESAGVWDEWMRFDNMYVEDRYSREKVDLLWIGEGEDRV